MAVPAPNTELGHAALIMKTSHFTTANGSTYTEPTSPGTSPKNPNIGTSTRSGSNTKQVLDPFLAQEVIRQFVHEQNIYATWRATHTLLKNQVLASVCDQYISHLKNA